MKITFAFNATLAFVYIRYLLLLLLFGVTVCSFPSSSSQHHFPSFSHVSSSHAHTLRRILLSFNHRIAFTTSNARWWRPLLMLAKSIRTQTSTNDDDIYLREARLLVSTKLQTMPLPQITCSIVYIWRTNESLQTKSDRQWVNYCKKHVNSFNFRKTTHSVFGVHQWYRSRDSSGTIFSVVRENRIG